MLPVILPVITGDLAQREALPRALWRLDLTSHADAWRYYTAMLAAGYQVRLLGHAENKCWDVCAPPAPAPTAAPLPADLARSFPTFAAAWAYWQGLHGHARSLGWDPQAKNYLVAAAPPPASAPRA